MIPKALTKCQHAEENGQKQAGFMNDRVEQKTARRCQKRQQKRGDKAMYKAQASNA